MKGKIKNLPRDTLISIVQNIKDQLATGKVLSRFDIIMKKDKDKNNLTMTYFWHDALLGQDASSEVSE